MLRWAMAAIHLLAFGVGFAAIAARSAALPLVPERGALRRVFRADAWWGVAALLWLVTGLLRLFMGLEKPTGYYLSNVIFWHKMALFLGIFLLELGPMVGLTRWRIALRRGQAIDTGRAARWAFTGRVQLALVIVMVALATAMARGYGS